MRPTNGTHKCTPVCLCSEESGSASCSTICSDEKTEDPASRFSGNLAGLNAIRMSRRGRGDFGENNATMKDATQVRVLMRRWKTSVVARTHALVVDDHQRSRRDSREESRRTRFLYFFSTTVSLVPALRSRSRLHRPPPLFGDAPFVS